MVSNTFVSVGLVSVLFVSLPNQASADQCTALATKEMAVKAAAFLAPGRDFVAFCEPCGDKPALRKANSASPRSGTDYWEVVVDGDPIDLAYTFVRDGKRNDGFANLADLVGCDATGVSLFVSNAQAGAPLATRAPEKSAGSTLSFVASSTLDKGSLGAFFRQDLGPASDKTRAPGKVVVTKNKITNVSIDVIKDSFKLEAYGNYLFASASVSAETSQRYMVIRISEESRQETLIPDEIPSSQEPLMLTAIHYGWAAYLIVYGSAADFNGNVAAQLMKAGGGLRTKLEASQLQVRLHLVGLKPKSSTNELSFPTSLEDVARDYERDTPAPITADYRVIGGLSSSSVEWKQPLEPGKNYEVNLEVQIKPTTASGGLWDNDKSGPDPKITWYLDGKPAGSCKGKNTFHATCRFFVKPTEGMSLHLGVVDADDWSDEKVGGTLPQALISSSLEVNRPFELQPSGQIEAATLAIRLP